jgi:hypothetical protein
MMNNERKTKYIIEELKKIPGLVQSKITIDTNFLPNNTLIVTKFHHTNICKPMDKTQPTYKEAKDFICRILKC